MFCKMVEEALKSNEMFFFRPILYDPSTSKRVRLYWDMSILLLRVELKRSRYLNMFSNQLSYKGMCYFFQ